MPFCSSPCLHLFFDLTIGILRSEVTLSIKNAKTFWHRHFAPSWRRTLCFLEASKIRETLEAPGSAEMPVGQKFRDNHYRRCYMSAHFVTESFRHSPEKWVG